MSDSLMGRLSYADPGKLLLLASLAVALAAGAYVGLSSYSTASLFDEIEPRYVSDEIYYVDVARRLLENVFGVELDYYDYSGKTNEDYYNPEHPPLGKYIIAAAMLACGDKPLCWRLPSIVEASLIPVILWAGFVTAFRNPAGYIAGVAAALGAASDNVLHVMGSVAMLDIHQAFFTAIAIALTLNRRFILAAIAAGLAAGVKMSGGAVVLAVAVAAAISLRKSLAERVTIFAAMLLVSGLVYAFLYLPLILHFGLSWVIEETIDAIRWHTSSRPEGPPTSTPLGWIFNTNPFYLSYSGEVLPASTNTFLHLYAVLALLGALVAEYMRPGSWPGKSFLFLFFLILLYGVVFASGNRTLYSFYSVQLTPAAAAILAEALIFIFRGGGAGCGATVAGYSAAEGGFEDAAKTASQPGES